MPDGKETNWEDGKSLDSGDQPVIQPQMFEKMRHSENTKQLSLIQKYLTGWPLVGNEGMNPHHSYVCMVSFPHSLQRLLTQLSPFGMFVLSNFLLDC